MLASAAGIDDPLAQARTNTGWSECVALATRANGICPCVDAAEQSRLRISSAASLKLGRTRDERKAVMQALQRTHEVAEPITHTKSGSLLVEGWAFAS